MAASSTHHFACALVWTGREQGAIRDYERYSREVRIDFDGKPSLRASSAPAFRGDSSLHNPEDLLVAALSACHFLTYAALCARAGVVLVDYEDAATGTMDFDRERKVMAFVEVTLRPHCVVAPGTDVEKARALHEKAHHGCFIASSVNFPVRNEPLITIAASDEKPAV